MTGYGGYGVSWMPGIDQGWQLARAWIELGGVAVSANLRGGGEYGRPWHEAGKLTAKQNVFDDFVACAEYLIDEGITRAGRIAINGSSNGGLLVGAVVVQRPELFGACIPEVGLLDMLRYHLFTSGVFWIGEFAALRAYSPVHNITPGEDYPPTMVVASFNDDHVVPWHSFKFAAALQDAQAGDAPILLRTESKIGHGAGKPAAMEVEDASDVLAFAAASLGLSPADARPAT
jgi:prolyl oligopeptidase